MSLVDWITAIIALGSMILGAGIALGVLRGTVNALRHCCERQAKRVDDLYQHILELLKDRK